MSTATPPTTSPPTSSAPTITGLPSSIPHFTPEDGCLDATNIWYGSRPCDVGTGLNREQGWCDIFLWDYNGGTEALPTSELATKACYPREVHVATRCPESYSVVGRESMTATDEGSGLGSQVTLYCCPEVYSFESYSSQTMENQDGDTATIDVTQCVATSPSFDGDSPYTLAVSSWATASEYAAILTTKTATFDTDSDLLFASMVTVSYEVIPSLDVTCAPNCESPWTGGEWPMPTQEVEYDPGPHRSDSSLRGVLPYTIAGITVGGLVGLAIIVGVTWCLVRKRRNKKRERAARPQQSRVLHEDEPGEDEAPRQKTPRVN